MNRYLEWIISGVIGAIIGMIITYSWSFYAFPILNLLKAEFLGNTITFKTTGGMTVKTMAKHFNEQMAEPGEQHYVVSCSPEAASIVVANTMYQPQRSHLEMLEHILKRNVTKLTYYKIENPKNLQILICSFRQNCKEIAQSIIRQ